MNNRINNKLVAEINVVPYIDVMLVLLVIFMITAPLLTGGVDVELPQANANPIDSEKFDPLIVSVDTYGNLYLNTNEQPNNPLDYETLLIKVKAQTTKDANKAVYVKGDKHVDYGKVVDAMVLLQHAGVKSVGLLTQDPDKS